MNFSGNVSRPKENIQVPLEIPKIRYWSMSFIVLKIEQQSDGHYSNSSAIAAVFFGLNANDIVSGCDPGDRLSITSFFKNGFVRTKKGKDTLCLCSCIFYL